MEIKKRSQHRMLTWAAFYVVLMAALLSLIFFLSQDELDEILPFLIGLALFAMLPIVIGLVASTTGLYTKRFDRYAAGLDEQEKQRLNEQIETGYRVGPAVLTDGCIVISSGFMLTAVPYQEIVWIYKMKQLVYFYSLKSLMIVTNDKKLTSINLGKYFDSFQTEEFVRRIAEKNPHILIGHDEEKARLFHRDFERMKMLAGQHTNPVR